MNKINAETAGVGLHKRLTAIGGSMKVEFGSWKNHEFAHTLAIYLGRRALSLVPFLKRIPEQHNSTVKYLQFAPYFSVSFYTIQIHTHKPCNAPPL